jgi:hypothetical protein
MVFSTEKENLFGLMVHSMRETTIMEKNKAMDFLRILQRKYIKAIGRMDYKIAMGFFMTKIENLLNKVYGQKENLKTRWIKINDSTLLKFK